jgi:Lipocalin-like domain
MDKPRADDQGGSAPLLGSWGLVSYQHILPSGEVLTPFGDCPSGLILYRPDGYMSAQLSVGNSARFASDEPLEAAGKEISERWQTYFGYWGPFTIDVDRQVVVHHVEGCSFPNWIGTEQVRHIRFEGPNRLILETESPSGRYTVIWQRKGDGARHA